MKDWRLLFVDVDDADEQRFVEGDFVSPGTAEVIKRLRDNAGVQVTSSRRRTLGRLRMLRNRIEHFAVRDARLSRSSSCRNHTGTTPRAANKGARRPLSDSSVLASPIAHRLLP